MIDNDLFFSVITVVYNDVNKIIKTIESVLMQEYKNIDYIIIDGNSNDGTLEEIRKYLNHKNVTLISEKDDGIYDAMNKGIKYSHGQIIYFLNSGDTLSNYKVISMINDCFKKLNCNIIYGNVKKIFNYDCFLLNQSKFKFKDLLIGRTINHQSIFAKKEVFAKIGGFDKRYKICADYDWIIKSFLEEFKINYVPIEIANYDTSGVSSKLEGLPDLQKEQEIIVLKHFGYFYYSLIRFKHLCRIFKLYYFKFNLKKRRSKLL